MVFGEQFRFYGAKTIEDLPAEILHQINLMLSIGDLGRLSVVSKYISECSAYAFEKHRLEHDKFKAIKSECMREISNIKHVIGRANFNCYGDLVDGRIVRTIVDGRLTSKYNKIPFEYTIRTIRGDKKLLIYKITLNISVNKSNNVSVEEHEFLEVTSNGRNVDCKTNFLIRRHLSVTFRYNEAHTQFSNLLGHAQCFYSEFHTFDRKETSRQLE
jgi:hypothetical protein